MAIKDMARWISGNLVFSRQSITELKKMVKSMDGKSLPEIVDACFNFSSYGLSIAPYQSKKEITRLLEILKINPPSRMMEIGTARGGTLFLFGQVANKNAYIVSLDLPYFRPKWLYRIQMEKVFLSLKQPGQLLECISKDSHNPTTRTTIESRFQGKDIDFLFIDGDHTYQGVKRDFEMYSPLVRKGGIIAFHDIAKHPAEEHSAVDIFWNQIKENYRHEEIFESKDQERYGIGVLWV